MKRELINISDRLSKIRILLLLILKILINISARLIKIIRNFLFKIRSILILLGIYNKILQVKHNLYIVFSISLLAFLIYLSAPAGSRAGDWAIYLPITYIAFIIIVELMKSIIFFYETVGAAYIEHVFKNIINFIKKIFENVLSFIKKIFQYIFSSLYILLFMIVMVSYPMSIIKYISNYYNLSVSEKIEQGLYTIVPIMNIIYVKDTWVKIITIIINKLNYGL